MFNKQLQNKEKIEKRNTIPSYILSEAEINKAVLEIENILDNNNLEKIPSKLEKLKKSCKDNHNGSYISVHNEAISIILQKEKYTGSFEIFNKNQENLKKLIDSCESFEKTFKIVIDDYYQALIDCYAKNTAESKYSRVLSFVLLAEEALANDHSFPDIQKRFIYGLRDRLIALFVLGENPGQEQKEIADGINNSWKYICNFNFLENYKFRSFNENPELIKLFAKKLYIFIENQYEKIEKQIWEKLFDLDSNYSAMKIVRNLENEKSRRTLAIFIYYCYYNFMINLQDNYEYLFLNYGSMGPEYRESEIESILPLYKKWYSIDENSLISLLK